MILQAIEILFHSELTVYRIGESSPSKNGHNPEGHTYKVSPILLPRRDAWSFYGLPVHQKFESTLFRRMLPEANIVRVHRRKVGWFHCSASAYVKSDSEKNTLRQCVCV
jgi:hypothetical protein